jgi:hypothetical protein
VKDFEPSCLGIVRLFDMFIVFVIQLHTMFLTSMLLSNFLIVSSNLSLDSTTYKRNLTSILQIRFCIFLMEQPVLSVAYLHLSKTQVVMVLLLVIVC